jgi:hypothetical protein
MSTRRTRWIVTGSVLGAAALVSLGLTLRREPTGRGPVLSSGMRRGRRSGW